jgi:4-hydroxyphenylpyruvate dioxygenase
LHGPSICSTGFRVKNAKTAFQTAVKNGARPFAGSVASKGIMDLPAVYGIGDSIIYFIDDQLRQELYQDHFHLLLGRTAVQGVGLKEVDHFTNNVPVGEMQKWCDFYQKVFHFRETRYFHIQGKQTGLQSRVMRSPCGKFSVPINEPTEKKSQIQEYLDEYKARLSAMRKGKKISEETRKKIDKKKQERESSPEFIEAKKNKEIERAERRKKQYDSIRESMRGFAYYTDHTGVTIKARTDDPRIANGEIWGKNKGKTTVASEESRRINSASKQGLKRYIDKDGNKKMAKDDDPRVLSGELIKNSWAK